MSETGASNCIRIGVTDLSFHRVTGAIVTKLLEQMGFQVERKYALHENNFNCLAVGEIDMIASAWIPFSHGIYKDKVEQQIATRELGLHYEPYAIWGVPDYVPQDQLCHISDLLKPQVKNRVLPLIQGIGAGAGITRFSIEMMALYGLSEAGYHFKTGTQDDCISAYEAAVARKQWVVVPLWHPQFLHAKYKIRELADEKSLLGGRDRAVLLAREDRLSASFSIEQVAVLDNIRLSNSIISALDYAVNREGLSADEAAHRWIVNNPDTVMRWMLPLN